MNQQETFDILNAQLKDIPKAQIRLMSLSVLPRLMGVLDSNRNHCSDCNQYSHEGSCFVNDIRPLFNQDRNVQKNFEKWVGNAQSHLKNQHQQGVKGRLTAVYTSIGMALGCITALVFLQITNSDNYLGGISLAWTVGMLIGYSTGKIKERRLNKNNKLY